jgi:predicted amidohydrolase
MAVAGSVQTNRDRIVIGIAQAAASRVRVAVFPEGVLRGQGGDDQAVVGEAVEAIRRAARESKVYVQISRRSPFMT